jgi:cell division protein FtsI (penicillin-binding protein 3)
MSAFEPGSTFKVVGATALLEASQVHPMDVFDCENGQFRVHGLTVKDWKSFANLTFAEVIQNSSNIGIIKAMEPLDSKKLFNIARQFGFSEKSGVRFPYENEGSLKNSNKWSSVSKSEISIGYEVSVTALQLAMAYASIGNGGILMKPRLVEKIKSPSGYDQDVDKIDAIRRVASETTMNTMSEILEKAVSNGTGANAFLPGLRIAGKTGTAKKLHNGKYVSEYIASFASFYPANDPDYALVIVIDHPRKDGYTGGMVAAPVAKEIYRRIYNLRGEAPVSYKPAERTVAKAKNPEYTKRSLKGQLLSSVMPVMKADNTEFKMPDLMGMTMKNSLSSVYSMSVKPEIHGSGRVIRQKPTPGKPIKPGQSVEIWYGNR